MTDENKLEKILANVGDLCFKRYVKTIIRYLDIQDCDSVLDCGCGEGFLSMVILNLHNCRVKAVDLDNKMIELAKQKIGKNDRIEFAIADIESLPFSDETFDKIILTEVLEHLPNDKKAIKEIYRVLKKRGIVGISVPNHNYPLSWDPLNKIRQFFRLGHFGSKNGSVHCFIDGFIGGIWAMHLRLYYPDEIRSLIESTGFRIERIQGLTHFCMPFNHNLLYLGKQFYTKAPVSKVTYQSMDKFEWKSAESHKNLLNPFRLALNILSFIDKLNDNFDNLKSSSVAITIKATKI